jgi:ribosomal protein S18 acetylase RimI-like enzyme
MKSVVDVSKMICTVDRDRRDKSLSLSSRSVHTIRRAVPSDADSIYRIKLEAFGDSFLPYTIYQDPRSVHYLEELISRQSTLAIHDFFVACQAGQTMGYYYAIRRGVTFFLSYIAVTASAQGRGLGRALLNHYETMGQTGGCQQLALDVFESNTRARGWYLDHGYRIQSISLYVRLATRSLSGHGRPPLHWSSDAWIQAIEEERTRGFSKIDCLCGSGRLTVGLIAGRVCKLLGYEGLTVEEALSAIGNQFCQTRKTLIASLASNELPALPVLDYEKSLRLIKKVGTCT